MPNVGHENQPSFTALQTGKVAVGVIEVQLGATITAGAGIVILKATTGNSGTITLGSAGLASGDGYVLAAGQSITLTMDKLDAVYALASAAAQGLEYLVMR